MKRWSGLAASSAILAGVWWSLASVPAVRADAVVGAGTSASCTEAALDAALLAGGKVRFNCGPAPKVVVLTGQKSIARDTSLEGGDLIVLSGDDRVGIVRVEAGVAFGLNHIVLTAGHGGAQGGGAVFNAGGTVVIDHSTLQDSTADGVAGAVVSTGGSVTFVDSEVRGNKGPAAGAVFCTGDLTVLRSHFVANLALASGGALQVYGAVSIRDSTFESNRAEEGDGGAIFASKPARVAIDGSRFIENGTLADERFGGAIASAGALTISNSSLIQNNSYSGGALRNDRGRLTMIRVTLTENFAYAGGGVYSEGGALDATDSTFDDNQVLLAGAGAAINGGVVALNNSTFSHNRAGNDTNPGGGGGLYVGGGEVALTNVTLSANGAGYGAGMFSAAGNTTLGNVTFIDNWAKADGDAIFRDGGLVVLRGSIVAGRLPVAVQAGIDAPRQQALCGGTVTSLGYNLAADASCRLDKTGDLEDEFAMLDSLADNGGPTLTHLPRPDSPAIDTGPPAGCPAADQRGVPRPFGAGCDKGAVEYVPPPTATSTPTLAPTLAPTGTATPTSTDDPTATPSPSLSPTVSASATSDTGPTDVSPSPTATVGPPSPTGPSPVASETATPTRSTSPTIPSTSQATSSAMPTATMPTATMPTGEMAWTLYLPWLGQPRSSGASARAGSLIHRYGFARDRLRAAPRGRSMSSTCALARDR